MRRRVIHIVGDLLAIATIDLWPMDEVWFRTATDHIVIGRMTSNGFVAEGNN